MTAFSARLTGPGISPRIGANVAVAVSLANAKAAASSLGLELFQYLGGVFIPSLPLPLGNVIGGGAHAENATEIQEFLVVPTGASGPKEAVFANAAVHKAVRNILKERGKSCGKGDEGAWAPAIPDAEAFEIVSEAAGTVSDEMDCQHQDRARCGRKPALAGGRGVSTGTGTRTGRPRIRSRISASSWTAMT